MEVEAFQRYWRETHGPLAATIPTIRRYVQSHPAAVRLRGRAPARLGRRRRPVAWFDDTMRACAPPPPAPSHARARRRAELRRARSALHHHARARHPRALTASPRPLGSVVYARATHAPRRQGGGDHGRAAGIGFSYARRFLAEGARVVVADIVDPGPAADKLGAGGRVLGVSTDVSDAASVPRAMVEAALARFTRIDDRESFDDAASLRHAEAAALRRDPGSGVGQRDGGQRERRLDYALERCVPAMRAQGGGRAWSTGRPPSWPRAPRCSCTT